MTQTRRMVRTGWMIGALLIFMSAAMAQQEYRLSAREAVDLALKNSRSLKNLELDYQKQVAQNAEITGSAYPQLNGSLSVSRFFSIPTTLLPDFISPSVYGVLEKEDVRDAQGNPIKAPEGPPNYVPAQFGVPWTASAGFTLQQILFQSDVFVGLKARSTALDYAKYAKAVAEDQTKEDVLKAYYAILISQEQMRIVDSNEARIRHLLQDNEVMYKNGFAEKLDIDRAQVTLNSILTGKVQLANVQKLGYATLKMMMNISQKDSIVLTDRLDMELLKRDLLDDASFKYEDRNEIKQLTAARRLLELDVQRNKLSYVPTISAFWNYSQNAQRSEFDFFKTGSRYPWFPTSVLGLQINVPIFDGFQRANRVKQARLELQKMENTVDLTRQSIDLQQTLAKNSYISNLQTLDIQERNVELAQHVYNTAKLKFEQGVGSSFEVIQTEIDLQNAQGKYFEAMYNAAIAKIAYERALGKL